MQLPERILEAEGRNCLGETTPTQAHPRVLAGLGAAHALPWEDNKENAFCREAEQSQAQGRVSRTEWDALGMPWVPCSEGKGDSTTPCHPTALTGGSQGSCSFVPSPALHMRGLCKCHSTGTQLPPPFALLILGRAVRAVTWDEGWH